MRRFTSKNGLIYEGNRVLEAPEADRLAQINDFTYAERLVAAFAVFTTDEDGKISSRNGPSDPVELGFDY